MQKVTFTKTEYTGKIASNRKEKQGLSNEYCLLVPDKTYIMRPLVTVRLYHTNATSYACVWINGHSKGVSVSGGGKAGGYGYHRASAALQVALNDAGVVLSENIAGRGETAMTDAMEAISKALGYKKFYIHNAHA